MKELVTRRRQTEDPLGWDIPSSAIHFIKVIAMSKYGDVLQGNLDGQDVAIKTLKPDSNAECNESFKRELDILSKLSHPHVVKLLGATLLAEPTSLIIELLPHSMLNLLHHGELCDVEVFRYARQVATGMEYLHSQDILHCDLAARNLLVSSEGEVKICDFSLSCVGSDPNTVEHAKKLNIRWSSPEVLTEGAVTRQSDIWSYGVLLYEFVTAGSVPYANFNNCQVKAKVAEGYRLAQPAGCLDEFYSLMMKCWSTDPSDRPQFREVITLLLNPLETILASTSDEKLPRLVNGTLIDEVHMIERKMSRKCKVKEPTYQSVVGKGGGLFRVYTALVAPFHPRVIIIYSKKMTMLEVVQLSLAKCGKQDLDYRSYAIALLDESHQPVKYLGPDDKIANIKETVSPSAQFVLCIRTPEKSLLEVIASIKQNPSYRNALDMRTRGYLIKSDSFSTKGSLKARNNTSWQRYWCVLDGSSLLLYDDEDDEGVKQFEGYLDFTSASVTLVADKKNNNFRVDTKFDDSFLFTASDKLNSLRWIEAIESSVKLEPSPSLLQASGGTVVHAGSLTCHRYPLASENNPLKPSIVATLGKEIDAVVTVNYGKLWSVMKSCGLIQCMVDGKPENLIKLTECNKIVVENQSNDSRSSYSINLHTHLSVYSIQADTTTDHCEWALALEGVLRQNNLTCILVNNGKKYRHSGYVALKRLMSLQGCGVRGSQIMSPETELDLLSDLYSIKPGSRASPDGCEEENSYMEGPPVPPRGSSAPPPPLPPRDPPPLPPKRGNSLQRPRTISLASTLSNSSNGSMDFDEYVVMQPHPPNPPSSLRFTSPTHSLAHISSQNCSIPSPITEGEDYLPMSSVSTHTTPLHKATPDTVTQPISIPGSGNRRVQAASKRCILLRSSSDVHDNAANVSEVTPPLPPRGPSPRHFRTQSSGSTHSLSRNTSINSLNTSFNAGIRDKMSSSLLERSMNGRNSPLIARSNSTAAPFSKFTPANGDFSSSEGMTIKDVRRLGDYMAHSQNGSVSSVVSSENGLDISGLSSTDSSSEDITNLPSGWERGYCNKSKRHFYFNASLGLSKWNYEEVCNLDAKKPGHGWNEVCMEDGRVYYYNESTRITTWDISDTYT
jgi:serine/threonine protein kinase